MTLAQCTLFGSGRKLILKVLALLRIRAHTLSSPPGLVAVIGDENAGRAPANPQMDGAAYARASPFPTNYLP